MLRYIQLIEPNLESNLETSFEPNLLNVTCIFEAIILEIDLKLQIKKEFINRIGHMIKLF